MTYSVNVTLNLFKTNAYYIGPSIYMTIHAKSPKFDYIVY